MSSWVSIELGKHCNIRTGKKDVNEGHPFGYYPFFTCSRNISWSNDYSFDTEAVLIAGNGDVGNLHYYRGKFEAYQRTYVLDNFNIDIHYVYQYLDAFLVKSLEKEKVGTSIPYIKLNNLQEFPIYLPLNPILQKKISTILLKSDKAIEKTQALIAKYENIKQGMMQDLFTRGVDESGQLRPSYEDASHLYQETELGWIPKEWKVVTLEDRIQKIEQGWSPDCEDIPADNGEWGVLKTTAVSWAGYQEIANKLLPKRLNPKPQYEVKGDDVLMTRAGPSDRVGVVAYVEKTQAKLMLSDKLYRIVPKASLKANYLSLSLSSAPVQKQIELLKTGMAESQSNISQDGIKKIRIAIPDTESEQLAVCKRLNLVVNKIISEKSNLSKIQSIKIGLMQDLLTGKVRVAEDKDERKEAVA